MKTFVRKNDWLDSFVSHGWGNGYVIIPKGNKFHGVSYDDIPVEVHGCLTFAEYASELDWIEIPDDVKDGWVVGFDTGHCRDTQSNWTEQAVMAETERLKLQLIELSK